MDTPTISLQTSGAVSSRFVTQDELDDAKKRKEDEWKAAYARIGEEAPPMPQEENYDPRSLFEKLSAQKEIKREEWDDKMKMSNQWRGLEADEVAFLRDVADEQRAKERSIKEKDMEELMAFKMRQVQAQNALPGPSTSPVPSVPLEKPAPTMKATPAKKGVKGMLKGLVVKKKDPNPSKSPVLPVPDSKQEEPPLKSTSPVTTVKQSPSTIPKTVTPLPHTTTTTTAATGSDAAKRKHLSLANDYGDSSDEESPSNDEGETKKQKTG